MKKYNEPELEVVAVVAEDIIQTSEPGPTPRNLTDADIMGSIANYADQGWDN